MFLFVFTINLTPIRQLLLITGSNDLVEINNVREWWSHKIFLYNTIITYFYLAVRLYGNNWIDRCFRLTIPRTV